MTADFDLNQLPPPGWAYARIDDTRRVALLTAVPLETLIGAVLQGVRVSGLQKVDPCDEVKKKAHRVGFQLDSTAPAAAEAMDQLLNGAYGLRARFALQPEAGQRATAIFCDALLAAIARGHIPLTADVNATQTLRAILEYTLRLPSAKAWFGPAVDRAPADLSHGEVRCDIWTRSRQNPSAVEAQIACEEFVADAQFVASRLEKGHTLPIPLSLDIKSAFVWSSSGKEYVPLNKRTRAAQIHLMGWS